MSPFMWMPLETNLGIGSFWVAANPSFEESFRFSSLEGKNLRSLFVQTDFNATRGSWVGSYNFYVSAASWHELPWRNPNNGFRAHL